MLFIGLSLLLYVSVVVTQVPTRVTQFLVNSAINSPFIIALTRLEVYRDDLVVLGAYGRVIGVRADNLTIINSLFDPINLTNLYITVDDDTGVIGVCTNREGRCQWMNVTTFQVLGSGDGLILSGESGIEVDERVPLILANTQGNVPSLFTASGNGVTRGLSSSQWYPIRTTQLQSQLSEGADLRGSPLNPDHFRRTYISTFKSGGYIYFVTLDKIPNRFIDITRICADDSLVGDTFHSIYFTRLVECSANSPSEVLDARLTMLDNGTAYEEFAVITYIGGGKAFTCAYSLQLINQEMHSSYQKCYVEHQRNILRPDIFLPSVIIDCLQTDSSNTECNLFPVGGNNAEFHLLTTAVHGRFLTSRSSTNHITVVIATQQDNGSNYSYYFVADGEVVEKYLMDRLSLVEPALEIITLPGSDSITDLKLDRSERTLFAITDRQLFRVPVADCGRHSTCEECVSDRDPLCGWCGIQNTCTRLSQCANYNLTNRWISDDTTSCFSISQVSPNTSNINLGNSVSISAVNLPQLSQSSTFHCVFGSLGTTVVSQVSGGFLSGPVQGPVTLICPIPTGISPFTQSAATTFQFSLSSTEFPSTSLFREFSFTLFDCSFHSNCSSCVSQSDTSECGWCPYSGECTHTDTLCPLTMSMGGQLEFVWIQDDTCPDLNVNTSTDSFAVESSHSITLQGSNLQPPVDNFSYQCSLNVSGSVTTLSADYVSSSSLSCAIPANTFSIQYPDVLSAVLSITLGTTALPLLSPTISVYNCSLQGDSCSACLTNRRRSAEQCGWCDGQSLCTATQLCSGMFLVDSCPDPIIRSISPPSISAEYTGNIVIIGEHLGTADEVVSVSASTNPPSTTFECVNVMRDLQTNGLEYSCRFTEMLGAFFTNPGQSSNTTLSLTVGNATSNDYPFYIAFPLIRSVVPSFGPVAGGTRVIVSGIGLGTGLTRSADILGSAGVLANCTSILNPSSNDGELVCITEPLSENINDINSGQFRVTIDGLPYLSTTGLFEFRSNPNVQSINPIAVIPSSPFNITFTGTSLNDAATPVIIFPPDPQPMPCFNATLTELICPFPSSIGSSRKRQSAVDFTLKFDGFEVSNPQNGISLIPNPTFTPIMVTFPENQSSADIVTTSIFLLLTGDTDYSEYGLADRFTVLLVGNRENITLPSSYQTDRIRAEIVNLQVEGTTSKTYTIYVTLGEYSTEAGSVIVLSTLQSLQGFLIGTGVSGAILIIIVIPLCVILVMVFVLSMRHCYSKHERKVRKTISKRMTQFEMENIEEMHPKKDRKGYSQILSKDEELIGVQTPFFSFDRFVLNFLFSEQPNHPVLYPAKIPGNKDEKEFRKALEMFNELLRDKDYFVSLVHCVESNRYFSLRDRSNIAGLFALCMYDEIEYLTAVLKSLLTDLTERMVSCSRAKLMFKRNESVAEKLLADWLALLMYNHLVEGAGPAIHTAFSAMKTLTEKGPVDVITGEAMYCLAEDKILRQVAETDNVQVTVEVRTEDGERLGVNLLRCDSITQVKLKIMDVMYHSVPVSQRPPVTELNLEAHSRMEGSGMNLRDRDRTCQVSDGWRRINTMSHYGTSSQVFKLVPRTQKVHGGHEQDYVGTLIQDNFLNADTNNPLMRDDRVWHLVPSPHRDNTNLSNEQLIRLSATKDSVQKYVDDMVSAIFPDVFLHPHLLPPPIKFLFDFLERQTEGHNIDNVADVIRQWKNNSVPLGFWVTLIKNPHYLFDVIRSGTMDSNLAVIAQVLIDSCTCTDSHITKTNKEKLLYSKEVGIYRENILSFYSAVTEAPPVTEEALFSSYQVPRGGEHFCRESALQALYSYAHTCKEKLLEVMQDDKKLSEQVSKFKEIYAILS